MIQLVNLLQYYGNYKATTKYSYLMEDPKVGDVVTDGSTYIGKVLSIKEVDNNYNYKTTYKMTQHLPERNELISKIRRATFIKDQRWQHEKDVEEYQKLIGRGWYIDPNYGFTIIDDYDYDYDYDWDWYPKEPSKEELQHYIEFIFKNLIER